MVYVLLDLLYWFTSCAHSGKSFSVPFCFLRDIVSHHKLVQQLEQQLNTSVFKLFAEDTGVTNIVFSYENKTELLFGQEVLTHRTLIEPCMCLVPRAQGQYYPLNYSSVERDFILNVLNRDSVPFKGDQSYANNLFTTLGNKLYLLIYYLYRALKESTEESYRSFYIGALRNAINLYSPGSTLDHIITYVILTCKVYPYVSSQLSVTLTN